MRKNAPHIEEMRKWEKDPSIALNSRHNRCRHRRWDGTRIDGYGYIDTIRYVYVVGWSELGLLYCGSQYGDGVHPRNLFSGKKGEYATSSKVVHGTVEEHGPPDIVMIMETFDGCHPNAARGWETECQSILDMANSPIWMNQVCRDGAHAVLDGVHFVSWDHLTHSHPLQGARLQEFFDMVHGKGTEFEGMSFRMADPKIESLRLKHGRWWCVAASEIPIPDDLAMRKPPSRAGGRVVDLDVTSFMCVRDENRDMSPRSPARIFVSLNANHVFIDGERVDEKRSWFTVRRPHKMRMHRNPSVGWNVQFVLTVYRNHSFHDNVFGCQRTGSGLFRMDFDSMKIHLVDRKAA